MYKIIQGSKDKDSLGPIHNTSLSS